jgi:hypothetical protein
LRGAPYKTHPVKVYAVAATAGKGTDPGFFLASREAQGTQRCLRALTARLSV